MDNYNDENVRSASAPTIHQFTFKNRLCVFCAAPYDLQEEHDSDWESLNEDTFINGVSILCEALNVKDNLNGVVGTNGLDNWRLLGIANFVQWICCERCYKLISELVSLQQLIVKSQISLKENSKKLENFVVVSSSQAHHPETDDAIETEAPSLEYSVNACVLLREGILNNFSKKTKIRPKPKPANRLPEKRRTVHCDKQAVILLKRLDISIKQEITPPCIEEICDAEFSGPSPPPSPEAIESDQHVNEEDEDQEYRPIKRRRRSTGRKRGRPKSKKAKPAKSPGKPGRPRKTHQKSESIPENQAKRKRTRKRPAFYLIEEKESESQLNTNEDQKPAPATIPSTRGGKPLIIGSRHYRFLHEGSGAKLQAIYSLSTSPPSPTPTETYLMMYNVKFSKTSTTLHCLHPDCSHQEPLTGYFTDQTILRNMRFHIRFAHRSPPKKDKPEENKPSFYFCHFCESQLNSKLDLLEHRRQLHSENDQCPLFCYCEVCGDPNVVPDDLVQHVFSHKSEHEKDILLNESNVKGFGKDKDILKPLVHPCDQCDKSFKCHTELMTHRVTHLPSELRAKVVCEICGRGCRSEWQVEHHKRRVHFRDLPVEYECHVCGKGFLRGFKSSWETHMNMHTGEKPYQCEVCGKSFISKKRLKEHVKLLHDGEKERVSCEFCGKVYKTDKYLRKHCFKAHRDKVTNKRELLFGEVDKDKYKPLEQREGFIGPKLMFPCEPCGKVFIFKSMLITHLKNRHKMFYERKEDYPLQLTLEDSMETGE